MKIAALAGAGHPGPGRARRWVAAGHEMIISSRTEGIVDRAQAAAAEMQNVSEACGA